ncbi:major capsid protein [Xanthomonas phage FoX4]|uniref:Major capsid protein n=1 Tax=Xanthomonas phage FoX4 TaxID=2723900 RepID=A0A858WN95_9CAUD|nr:major head protein [Xanthomonas phage FoX4]QJI52975.1 major capsid protein [Xanthomonas phage FoX4]
MAGEYYDTATLLAVQRKVRNVKPFWLNFFTQVINFDDDNIIFDRVNEDYRRRAPFVAPNVQGKIMADEGYDTMYLRPAYLKPKHAVDIFTPFRRQAGETPVTGSLSPGARRDAKVAQLLQRQDNMITMTEEYMAASAVISGSVVIEGENYPRTVVNFQRDPSLTVVLSGTARWGQADANPLEDLREARANVNTRTNGGVVRDYIFGREAFDLFMNDPKVQKLLDKNYRGSETEISAINDGFEDSVEYMGRLTGLPGSSSMRLWVYTGKERGEDGVLRDMMDPLAVVGIAPEAFGGTRCYGAIKDGDADFVALSRFPKNWKQNEDPWQEMVMTQSAPLMVPSDPDGSFMIKVG